MEVELKRRISPTTLFLLTINAIIGSGWLFAPLYVAKTAGPAALVSWGIGGGAAILIALTFAELSTMLPVAGGTAHIPQLSHGTFVSFIFSWVAWLTTVMLTPIEIQAVLQYASLFLPGMMHEVNGIPTLTGWGYMGAMVLMISLCLINIVSYRGLVRFNFVFCVFKFTIILLTIFAIFHVQFHPSNFSGFTGFITSQTGWHAIFSAVSTGGIVLAFNGFKSGVEMAGETNKLSISIPLATVGSILACLLLYIGLQVVFIGAIDPLDLGKGWQNLSFAGDIGPFVGLTMGIGLFWLLKFLYTNAIISPLGAGLVYVTASGRILYAMSRIGYVPKFLSQLNDQRFPVWAIIINFLVGMFSFLPLPGWQAMVNFLVSGIVITYAMGPIALLSLRKTLPQQPRPFRLPFANLICFVAFYSCNLFSYWTGWETVSKLAIVLTIGIGIFVISCKTTRHFKAFAEIRSGFWVVPYLLGIVLISYFGGFGGKNVVPFGWDFGVIALFSLSILHLASKSRSSLSTAEVNHFLLAESAALRSS